MKVLIIMSLKCWEVFAFAEKYRHFTAIFDAIISRVMSATKNNILVSAAREKRDTRALLTTSRRIKYYLLVRLNGRHNKYTRYFLNKEKRY